MEGAYAFSRRAKQKPQGVLIVSIRSGDISRAHKEAKRGCSFTVCWADYEAASVLSTPQPVSYCKVRGFVDPRGQKTLSCGFKDDKKSSAWAKLIQPLTNKRMYTPAYIPPTNKHLPLYMWILVGQLDYQLVYLYICGYTYTAIYTRI